PFLAEVVAFERAMIELRRPRPGGQERLEQVVRFRHDPRAVLGPLAAGRRPPRRLPARALVLRVALGPEGALRWSEY
ncbi:MAG TPA: hypothetical protein VFO85_08660, partial [Vicinamibacteria bacterium]|nr:hypothetical protein [Vicinamibacteria bacterium]